MLVGIEGYKIVVILQGIVHFGIISVEISRYSIIETCHIRIYTKYVHN